MINYEYIKEQSQLINTAFVEAMISYSTYDKRRWMIERSVEGNPVMNALLQANTTAQELTTKKTFELYASLFSKTKFEKVDLQLPAEEKYISKKYGFTTTYHSNIGDYEALNNLARAAIVRSKNADDTYTLHVSYRGTDTDARTFQTFVTDAYLDMSAYYDAFKPLEEALLKYVQNPENKISKINVSGHSLGGAMVPEFFNSPEVQKINIPLQGLTYGAPGNRKKPLYSLLPALYHTITAGKFLQLGKAILDVLIYPVKKDIDSRITQYSHLGDLIPRVAALVYEKEGNQITLEDIASSNLKESLILTNSTPISILLQKRKKSHINVAETDLIYKKPSIWTQTKDFVNKAVTFQYHDMLRYIINIDNQAQNLLHITTNCTVNNLIKENMPDILQFNQYNNKFDNIMQNNHSSMKDIITQRLQQKAKAAAIEQGLWGGELPKGTKIVQNIEKIRKESLGEKIDNEITSILLKIKNI